MREILFRGKRKDNGKWVYGYYFAMHHNDDRDHIHQFLIPLDTPLPKDRPIGDIQVEVDPPTVDQYTGLTDRNGKRIFEGDVVTAYWKSNDTKQTFRVIFESGAFPFENGYARDMVTVIYDIEVIGNVHDNPELLERGRSD